MQVKYISYIQTETLFKAWPTIQAIKESLVLELETLGGSLSQSEIDGYISSKAVGNKELTGVSISGIGGKSDITGNTAISYKGIMDRDYKSTLEAIQKERIHIELVDDKLDIAFRRLSPMQQQILKLFYLDSKTWAEVLDELKKDKHFVSKQQAQTQRRYAIEKMQSISKITVDMYQFVMKLVEVD